MRLALSLLALLAAAASASPPGDPVVAGLVPVEAVAATPRVLVEVTRPDCPARVTLTPRLVRRAAADPASSHVLLEVTGWEDPRALRLGLTAVPLLVLYEDGVPVARGPRAWRRFLGEERPAPVPVRLARAAPPAVRGL